MSLLPAVLFHKSIGLRPFRSACYLWQGRWIDWSQPTEKASQLIVILIFVNLKIELTLLISYLLLFHLILLLLSSFRIRRARMKHRSKTLRERRIGDQASQLTKEETLSNKEVKKKSLHLRIYWKICSCVLQIILMHTFTLCCFRIQRSMWS